MRSSRDAFVGADNVLMVQQRRIQLTTQLLVFGSRKQLTSDNWLGTCYAMKRSSTEWRFMGKFFIHVVYPLRAFKSGRLLAYSYKFLV